MGQRWIKDQFTKGVRRQAQIAERDVAVLAQLGPVLLHRAGDGTETLVTELVVRILEPAFRILETADLAVCLLCSAPQRQPQRNRVRSGPPRSFQTLELGGGRTPKLADSGDERRAVRPDMAGQRDRILVGGNGRPAHPELDHGAGVDARARTVTKRDRLGGHQLSRLAPGVVEHVASLAHRFRVGPERNHLVARLRSPLVGQYAIGSAHRAAFSLRMRVHVKRLLEQRGHLMRSPRVGAAQPLCGSMRVAQLLGRRVESLAVEHRQPGQVTKFAEHAALVALGIATDLARDGLEIPRFGRQGRTHQLGSLIGGPLEQRAERRQRITRRLDIVLTVQTRLLQHLLRGSEVTESEDARERVVELRLLAVERVLELIV